MCVPCYYVYNSLQLLHNIVPHPSSLFRGAPLIFWRLNPPISSSLAFPTQATRRPTPRRWFQGKWHSNRRGKSTRVSTVVTNSNNNSSRDSVLANKPTLLHKVATHSPPPLPHPHRPHRCTPPRNILPIQPLQPLNHKLATSINQPTSHRGLHQHQLSSMLTGRDTSKRTELNWTRAVYRL